MFLGNKQNRKSEVLKSLKGKETVTMREQLKEKLNAQLGELAGDILISTSSLFCWGEVEVPELLRAEVEEADDSQTE